MSPSCIRRMLNVVVNRAAQTPTQPRRFRLLGIPITAITTLEGVRLIVDGECCYSVNEATELIDAYQN